MSRVRLGSEVLLDGDLLKGKRVGLVSNPASIDASFRHVADRLLETDGIRLAALFGPQHGFNADVQDNMIETGHATDRWRKVPVYSLYSETREPTAEMLRDLDVLVVDLQDVGARIYTFVYTMANCLRVARKMGLPVIVCDRPNPTGGTEVEGEVLLEGWESFVGQFPIPMRHGMTIGELARLFNEHHGIGADLTVVPMEGWRREMYWDETLLPWVMPSPNMPTLDTAIVYPGGVLFEGTNLSEGRGTTRPFELLGAPWLDAVALCRSLNSLCLGGVYFRPVSFEPTFHKHARQTCGGCQIHVTDRTAFRPVLAGVAVMREMYAQDPEHFGWRQPPYEYEYEKLAIDILAGSDALRRQIESGTPATEIARSWEDRLAAFSATRERFLLY
ncbi:MAG: exo-beta-N-acetylmuramidase NamZ domain-containing protein [Vicinamibacterales bacterium]